MYTKLLVVLSVRTIPLIEHLPTVKNSEVTDIPMRELGKAISVLTIRHSLTLAN